LEKYGLGREKKEEAFSGFWKKIVFFPDEFEN